MPNNNYKPIIVEAGTYALIGFALNAISRLINYAMEPDVLVEEKAYLEDNRKILMANFTK